MQISRDKKNLRRYFSNEMVGRIPNDFVSEIIKVIVIPNFLWLEMS